MALPRPHISQVAGPRQPVNGCAHSFIQQMFAGHLDLPTLFQAL